MAVAAGAFTLFAASQVGTPGPANMALLATGARFGFRAALPFVAGVVLGKQLVIWPIGLGLMEMAETYPGVFSALKYVSAAYILWLAWRVANLRLAPGGQTAKTPGFWAGLAVHPLNPKAWGMIIAGFTNFADPGASPVNATAIIAVILFASQCVLHPVWAFSGDRIARAVAGKPFEPYVMWILAGLTALSVLMVVF